MSNQTDETVTAVRHSGSGKAAIFFSLLAIILSICGIGYIYFLYTQLQSQASNTQVEIAPIQQSIDKLQKTEENAQSLTAKQEQMIADWQASQKGDLNKWYVAEAAYLVKLANDHLQFTHDTSMVIVLLQQADQVLGNLQTDNVVELRKSIAANIASLQTVPAVDVTQTYLRLTTLNNQIDQLPLPVNPIANEAKPTPHIDETGLPWWKIGLNRTWEALQKIVVVRYNHSNALPLVMPEEKIFLYQNLHAQMEQVIWGLLHRNNDVYQTSLTQTIAWIQKYFAQDAQLTKTMLQNLQEMQKINFQSPSVNIAVTLQLFESFLGETKQVRAVQ